MLLRVIPGSLDPGGSVAMNPVLVVQPIVDGIQIVALLRGTSVTVLTNLAGNLREVGKGAWDGEHFECPAWLGRDDEHHAMMHAAIEEALTDATRIRARKSDGKSSTEEAVRR